jgi:regulator of sigma E protease
VVGYQDNIVSMVLPGTPAEKAGLQKDDVIVAVNGEPTSDYHAIGDIISTQSEPVSLAVERGGNLLDLTIEPPTDGDLLSFGFICGLKERHVRESLPQALLDSATTTGVMVGVSIVGIYQIVTGQIPLREAVGGPITMADFAGQTAMAGWQTLLRYVALLSIVLFILNLLPIPVLDGGNIALSIIELFRGKPVSLGFRMAFQQVGIFIVLGIMALAIVMDVIRYAF